MRRKPLINEGIGFLSEIVKPKPKVEGELPTTDELAEKLEEIYPRRPQRQNKPPKSAGETYNTPISMPSTEDTVQELKRRLAKELYRMEMDLQAGARIANRPCDCLGHKHNLGLEATAEELMSYEAAPVYGEIITWLRTHEAEFEPSEIAKRPPEYYHKLVPEVRRFRKEIMGTAAPSPVTLEEAKKLAAEEAAKEIEKRWQSH